MEAEAIRSAASLPQPERIHEIAQEILGRPYYKLENASYEYDFSFLKPIVRFIGILLRPFQLAFEALLLFSPVLAYIVVIGLILIAVALIVHIVYSFKTALRERKQRLDFAELEKDTADEPTAWEKRAAEAAAKNDYISALRYLFRACLLRLEAVHNRTFKRAATNREYLRRFHESPAFSPLSFFVEMIDIKWYGRGVCTAGNYREGLQAHQLIRHLEEEMAHAERT